MGHHIAEVTAADISIRFLLLDRINYLKKAGYDVTAVCAPGRYVNDLRDCGVRIHLLPIEREISPLQDLRTFFQLISLFRRERFDIVFSHTPKPGLLVPLAARVARAPLIIHSVHGLLFHDKTPPLRRLVGHMAERFTAFWCHHLFFVSAEDAHTARRLLLKRPSRLFYIGNGIDTARFRPASTEERRRAREALGVKPDTYVIGTVGRLVWEKGYGELLEAADALAPLDPEMLFILVGPTEPQQHDGLQQADLDRIEDLPYVRWLGEIDDLPPIYAAMDLFVLPSHREGTPLTVMEAAATQLPVVASDIRGCREVVIHGETGLLVPLGDVSGLVSAIRNIRRDPERAAAMGTNGRRLVISRFDQDAIVKRLGDKLRELLHEDKSSKGGRRARP
jgi:glycosyltransferase involved in cell wall biosynthesis